MKIDAVSSRAVNPITVSELEEIYNKRRQEASVSQEEAAAEKVQEAQNANTQATFKMMDRHSEMVKKSQEIANVQAKKRAMERLAQKRAEEHSEMLVEMALRNEERSDLLKEPRME